VAPYSVAMNSASAPTSPELDHELSALEARLAALVAHAQALRDANDALRRDLAAAQEKNERLDALLARLPGPPQ
jgi:uncharacterized membrane protein